MIKRSLFVIVSTVGLSLAMADLVYGQLLRVKSGVVNILGATEGSGVIISSHNNIYKIATAWHVIAPNHKNEQVLIKTSDGKKHISDNSSIEKLPNIDIAVLSFSSDDYYPVVPITNRSISSGTTVMVSGWPSRENGLKTTVGKLISMSGISIDQGYSILYTNKTMSGMSGGPIFSKQGRLIGIHGRGEKNEEEFASSFKTGINQGVPAFYLKQYLDGKPIRSLKTNSSSCGDYLAEARQSISIPNGAKVTFSLAEKALKLCSQSGHPYFLLGYSARKLGQRKEAIRYYERAHSNNVISSTSLSNLAATRVEAAILDGQSVNFNIVFSEYQRALRLDPSNIYAIINLSSTLQLLQQEDEARDVLINGLSLYPHDKNLLKALHMLQYNKSLE